MYRGCAIVMMMWLCAVSRGQAQSVVVLVPPEVRGAAPADMAERALQSLTDKLRADGFNIVSNGQAASAVAALSDDGKILGRTPHECTSEACAVSYREFFEAKLALRLEVREDRLLVTLVESDRDHWTGRAAIRGDDVEVAAEQALADAEAHRAAGDQPWVRVVGSPEGAEVWIDGSQVGVLPFEGVASPGEHTVEVRAEGMVSETLQANLEDGAADSLELSVTLQPEPVAVPLPAVAEVDDSAEPTDGRAAQPTAVYDWAAGGAMIAAGVVLAVVAPTMYAIREEGQCVNGSPDRDTCPQLYGEVPIGATVGMAVGGAALVAGGILVLAKQPIRLRMGADRHGARVAVTGRF